MFILLFPNLQFVQSITKIKFFFYGKIQNIKPETSFIVKSKFSINRCILLIELSGEALLPKAHESDIY